MNKTLIEKLDRLFAEMRKANNTNNVRRRALLQVRIDNVNFQLFELYTDTYFADKCRLTF